jgi:hypothetical protein
MAKMKTGGPKHGAQHPVKVKAAGGKAATTPTARVVKQTTSAHGPYAAIKVKAAAKKK